MDFRDPAPVTAMRELLISNIAGLSVSTRYPREGKLPHVRLDYLGGRPVNRVTDGPRFGIQVYAKRGPEAERLTGQIKTLLAEGAWRGRRTSEGHMLRGWAHESMMSLADPDRPGFARWQIMGRLQLSMLRPD